MALNIQSSIELINECADAIEKNFDVILITDAFRYLRNLCGTNPESQKQILKNSDILQNTKKILLTIISNSSSNQQQILTLQVGLQFIANLIVNNSKNQEEVWLTCKDLFNRCLKFNDPKVQNYCAMILYNIFLGKSEYLDQIEHPFEDLIELATKENTSEFAVYTLELFVLSSNYVEKFYEILKPEFRLLLMEVIKDLITEQHNQKIKPEIIKFFSSMFIKKSDSILKICKSYADSLDPVEVVKMLDLLVAFSSDDLQCYLSFIQKETSLLINCIMLLRSVHEISKQSGNDFSMLNKLSEFSNINEKILIQENPVFGFKSSLIRLIGNLCWKNSINQNKVREMECIPVILDSCNMDARNPFIIQWCILAIRNILEKNYENQKFLAALSKEGKIDPAKLQELGITLNENNIGNSLCIAPLPTKENLKNS